MRLLLFKAFARKRKKMFKVSSLCHPMNGKHHTVFSDTGVNVAPSIVLQYTGVDDVRGQQLFEGDVVEVVTRDLSGLFIIRWTPGKYILSNERTGQQPDLSSLLFTQERNLGHMLKKGNIYEGPSDQAVLPSGWPRIIGE